MPAPIPVRKGCNPYYRGEDGLLAVQRDFLQYLREQGGTVQADLTALGDAVGYHKRQISTSSLELEARGTIKILRFPKVWGPDGCNKYELVNQEME